MFSQYQIEIISFRISRGESSKKKSIFKIVRFLRKRHFCHFSHQNKHINTLLSNTLPTGNKKRAAVLTNPAHDFLAPSGNITRMPFNDNLFYKAPIVLLLKSTLPCVSRPFTRRAPQNKNHFRMTIGLLTHSGVSPATIPIDFSFFLLYLFGF